MTSVNRGAVLVTGASTGIGRDCSRYLHDQGFRVFAGVRRREDGEALRALASDQLSPVLLDVTDSHSIASALEEVRSSLGSEGLQGLVNNAGVYAANALEATDLDEFRRLLEVNVVGLIAVTQAFLPSIRAVRGRIVNMGSIAGYRSPPLGGAYAASKFAVEGLTDALRRELRPWGIHVVVIEPGAFKSEMLEKASRSIENAIDGLTESHRKLYGERLQSLLDAFKGFEESAPSGEVVARVVFAALTDSRPRFRYQVGRDAKKAYLLCRTLPGRILDGVINRTAGYR